MTKKIDVFAHVLLPNFYRQMLEIEPKLPERFPFIQHPQLTDIELRRSFGIRRPSRLFLLSISIPRTMLVRRWQLFSAVELMPSCLRQWRTMLIYLRQALL